MLVTCEETLSVILVNVQNTNAPRYFQIVHVIFGKTFQQHYELCSACIYKMFTMTQTGSGFYLLRNMGSRRSAHAPATPSPSRRKIPVEAAVET